MNAKLKHLEMIQAIIKRMASNSFHLKSWSVILVSALFALSARNSNIYYIYLAYFPAIAFWILDGYFLWQEKLFRKLYDKVRKFPENEINFSMKTSEFMKNKKVCNEWFKEMISVTLIIFHGIIIGSILIVMILIIISK